MRTSRAGGKGARTARGQCITRPLRWRCRTAAPSPACRAGSVRCEGRGRGGSVGARDFLDLAPTLGCDRLFACVASILNVVHCVVAGRFSTSATKMASSHLQLASITRAGCSSDGGSCRLNSVVGRSDQLHAGWLLSCCGGRSNKEEDGAASSSCLLLLLLLRLSGSSIKRC